MSVDDRSRSIGLRYPFAHVEMHDKNTVAQVDGRYRIIIYSFCGQLSLREGVVAMMFVPPQRRAFTDRVVQMCRRNNAVVNAQVVDPVATLYGNE